MGKSFDIGRLKKDETTLIHGGASGIGTTALAICHALGIKTFATVGSEDKVEALSDLTTAINYKTQDFEQEILNHTQEQGVDVILDIVGGSYFQKNLNLLKRDGRLVIIGFMGGRIAKEFDLQKLILKRATITGSTMRARNSQEKHRLLNLYMNMCGHYWSKASVYHKSIKPMLFRCTKCSCMYGAGRPYWKDRFRDECLILSVTV